MILRAPNPMIPDVVSSKPIDNHPGLFIAEFAVAFSAACSSLIADYWLAQI
jgi:hypothetical protein